LGEQKRIVAQLDALFSRIDQTIAQLDAIAERAQALESATTRQLKQLQALKASLLDAAFRGQL
jgi:restriction endonuclease S subunit